MSWIRSAMNKAAEVPGGAIFRAAVRTYADSFVQHAGYSVSGAARMFQDRIAPRNLKSFSEAARMLEEASVSCKGEERVQLLRRWLVALRAFERLDGSFVEIDGKSCEDPGSPSDKNDSPGKSTMIVYYDPDLGSLPMNFRDVFLQSQALEGITMSMILGAPNEEEISLIHEIFGLCLAGGKEVHDVVVKNIQDLAKAFSVYDVEMLVRREELLQFAQTAITGLKVSGDIARIDSEISQIQQRLNRMKSEDSESSSESTSNASSKDIEEPVTHIQLCCRLKSLLLKKRLLRIGDTIETHTQKVDILKVLIESLHNSASKTEKRILEHREEKKEALTFRVARTDEVSQIEKEVGAEISVLEKQRDKLEAELREVNNTLAAAYMRLQNAREERFQFDEDNNDFLLLLKEKEEELSMTIVSYKAEADTCHAFVNFLEATWAFQSSYVEQRDKQVNDQLQDHEVYFVNATSSFLSTYKDQLPRAIANLRRLEESVKGFRKIIDPDDEFLQDIKQREKVEQEYVDAEAKVVSIFDAVETIKEYFYSTIDDPSRKGIEAITALFEAIEYFKSDFRSIKRPNLTIEKLTEGEDSTSPGSPQGVMVPPPIRVMPDFKSIFAQKLLIKSPRQKPYVPLGGSPENSPMGYNAMSAETEQHNRNIFESENTSHYEKDASDIALEFENDQTMIQKTTTKSDQESSDEIPKLPLTAEESGGKFDTTETVCGETSQVPTGGDMKSVDSDEELSTSRTEKEMSTN